MKLIDIYWFLVQVYIIRQFLVILWIGIYTKSSPYGIWKMTDSVLTTATLV